MAKSTLARKVLVEFHGDSTTFGADPFNQYHAVRWPVPELVERSLHRDYAFDHIECLNFGVSGTQAVDLLRARPGWRRQLEASPASVVVLNFGINDVWARPDPLAGFAAMRQLVTVAAQQGKVVVVETPNPVAVGMGRLGLAEQGARLACWCAALRVLAVRHGAYLCDHHAHLPVVYPKWREHTPDGIHPDQTLYRFKARRLTTTLVDVLVREGLARHHWSSK